MVGGRGGRPGDAASAGAAGERPAALQQQRLPPPAAGQQPYVRPGQARRASLLEKLLVTEIRCVLRLCAMLCCVWRALLGCAVLCSVLRYAVMGIAVGGALGH